MRIHIQNPADDPLFEFSRPIWDAAVARAPDIGRGHSVTIGATDRRLRRRDARSRGAGLRRQRRARTVPVRRTAPETAVRHQCRSRPAGAVRLAAARRGTAEQPRHARGEGGRVRHHGRADAGQPRAGDGDASTRRTMAKTLGHGARRQAPDRGRARHAGRRDRIARGAFRHARHRRARASRAASRLRRGDRHRSTRRRAATHGLSRARLPADRGDTWHDGPAAPGAAAARRGTGEYRPRRIARPGCAVRSAGRGNSVRCGTGRVHAGTDSAGPPAVDARATWSSARTPRPTIRRPTIRAAWTCSSTTCARGATTSPCRTASTQCAATEEIVAMRVWTLPKPEGIDSLVLGKSRRRVPARDRCWCACARRR